MLLLVSPAAFAQRAGTGSVTGVVYDATTGNPVPHIDVSVVGLLENTATTTIDGTFRLQLPTGTYALKLTGAKYMDADVTDVIIIPGEVVDASTVMAAASDVTSVDVVETITVETATAESMVAERKLAASVTDSISAEEIKGSSASDAAGALQKVTGVTISEDGNVFVRGLGERYSAAQLNNAMMATTEPEKRVVPLDLFPAGLIDNIQVLKTYTPDLPGEFSAGLVKIRTSEFPSKAVLQVNYKIGFNTQTTGKKFYTYPGGSNDFWGRDDGTRNLPNTIPGSTRVDRFNFSRKELQDFGRSLPVNWQLVPSASARPTQDFGVVAGNTYSKWGIVGAFQFSNAMHTIPNQIRRFYEPLSGGGVRVKNDFDYDASTMNVRMGGILNASYQANASNKLFIRNFLSRDTDDEGRDYVGFHDDFETQIRDQRLRWVERQIYSLQGGGEHLLAPLANSILTWQLGYSRATRDEPDLREMVYRFNDVTEEFEYFDDANSSARMYNDQLEKIWNPQVNWMLPFYKGGLTGSIKLGYDYTNRDRDFSSRRLRFRLAGSTGIDPTLPPNDLLGEDNIRPNGFELTETTRVTDAYLGEREVHGGYGMIDVSLSPKLRVVGGVRVEAVDQLVTSFDQFNPENGFKDRAPYSKTNLLPGINVVYYLTPKHNFRGGYSRTLSRPDFREIALFDFQDIVGGRLTVGNPNLIQTTIDNFDARWEFFPGGSQLIAATFFYKKLTDPIERTVKATTGLLTTFDNAGEADNYGIELEFRRNLGFMTQKLSEFALSSNYTYVHSTIDLSNVEDTVLTTKRRAMQGQSAHVFNFITEWARPR
jgi:outer membrane receptor protein involved in Fe transport